jgi:hypothetical protein
VVSKGGVKAFEGVHDGSSTSSTEEAPALARIIHDGLASGAVEVFA